MQSPNDRLNVTPNMVEYVLDKLRRKENSSRLNESQSILDRKGPDRNYTIRFEDPDGKINSILGLNDDTLGLAYKISDLGSIEAFVEAEQWGDITEMNTMWENGFWITLAEKALSGIHTTDLGDTDEQRLFIFLALVSLSLEIREERENNYTVVLSSFDRDQPHSLYEFENWMGRVYDENLPRNSYLYVYLRPEYSPVNVDSALKEILPNLNFWFRGRELVMSIPSLRQRIFSFYD